MHFAEFKILYFDSNFIEVYSWWSICHYIVIGWGNSFVTNRWQAIGWTNADPDLPHMASLDSFLYNKPTNSWKHRSVYTILWNIWHQFLNLLLAKIRTQGHMVKLRTFPGIRTMCRPCRVTFSPWIPWVVYVGRGHSGCRGWWLPWESSRHDSSPR